MAFWAYILQCGDESYYTGHTDDIEKRIAQHQSGEIEGYTQKRRPVELVWHQEFSSRDDAFQAEQQIKGWSRVKKKALFRGDWATIRCLASRAVLRDGISPFDKLRTSTPPQDERVVIFPAHPEEGLSEVEGASRRIASTLLPPLVILVRPQLGENIGKAARAMLNFGLTELRLVSPRDGWPNPDAGPAAAGADIVLEQAQVFETVAEAVADCAHIYATTVRKRGMVKPVVNPQEAAAEMRTQQGRSAILFGAERSGLENDEVALARTILTVPINPDFGSLNLAQAVILVAYEWSKGCALASPPKTDIDPPAPQEELDGMIGQLDAMLDAKGYYHPPERAHVDRWTLRSLLTKPGWSAQEVRTFRGVLRSLARKT